MPEEVSGLSQLSALLVRWAGAGVPSTRIADVIVDAWTQIDIALAPIVGRRAVATLHKRSLFLTTAAHPWLAEAAEGLPEALDLEALKVLLGQHPPADVAAAGGALLLAFRDLLASLVGPSLTERLLRSVWVNSLSGPAAKDSPP